MYGHQRVHHRKDYLHSHSTGAPQKQVTLYNKSMLQSFKYVCLNGSAIIMALIASNDKDTDSCFGVPSPFNLSSTIRFVQNAVQRVQPSLNLFCHYSFASTASIGSTHCYSHLVGANSNG